MRLLPLLRRTPLNTRASTPVLSQVLPQRVPRGCLQHLPYHRLSSVELLQQLPLSIHLHLLQEYLDLGDFVLWTRPHAAFFSSWLIPSEWRFQAIQRILSSVLGILKCKGRICCWGPQPVCSPATATPPFRYKCFCGADFLRVYVCMCVRSHSHVTDFFSCCLSLICFWFLVVLVVVADVGRLRFHW